ncbi:MAG: hypothetical protein HY094_07095 [Candidatus Melainabacteria bacterium]|nr:hypothetical protein [Candidatus Melainabacteria bacterium]
MSECQIISCPTCGNKLDESFIEQKCPRCQTLIESKFICGSCHHCGEVMSAGHEHKENKQNNSNLLEKMFSAFLKH